MRDLALAIFESIVFTVLVFLFGFLLLGLFSLFFNGMIYLFSKIELYLKLIKLFCLTIVTLLMAIHVFVILCKKRNKNG